MNRKQKSLATAATCFFLLGVVDLAVLNLWLAPAVWPYDGETTTGVDAPSGVAPDAAALKDSSPMESAPSVPAPIRPEAPKKLVRVGPEPDKPLASLPPTDPAQILDEFVLRFDPGVYVLTGKDKLKVVGWMRRSGQAQSLWIEVEGHADRTGDPEGNIWIAEKRAEGIGVLLKQTGFPPNKITTVGYGSSRPVDPRNNSSAWAKNRRVVIRIYKGKP